MKVLSRDFTKTEKILITVLPFVVLMGLVYYQFVDKNVRTAIENAKVEAPSPCRRRLTSPRPQRAKKLTQPCSARWTRCTRGASPTWAAGNSSKAEVGLPERPRWLTR